MIRPAVSGFRQMAGPALPVRHGGVAGRAGAERGPVPGCTSNIRHLTDVSHCNLHQHLSCNREIKCLSRL
jgi:hypothetical protein